MAKPLIGITCSAYTRDTGDLCYGVMPAYTRSVAMAGGLPLLIPPNIDHDALREIYDHVDGVLLSGGGDVDPARYGMSADDLVEGVSEDRDRIEIDMVRWAAAEDKPLFGICRGSQVANVALGGTLYRDIPKEYAGDTGIDHDYSARAQNDRGDVAHPVKVDGGTTLASILGTQEIQVNTMHHQSLREIAPALIVSASAPDGIIEGAELRDARFFVTVQWHPEEMTTYSEPMRRLFAAFVDATRNA
jgi:putative glutamine amidotransferase